MLSRDQLIKAIVFIGIIAIPFLTALVNRPPPMGKVIYDRMPMQVTEQQH